MAAEIVFVEGETGSGKSASLRNMPVKESLLITASDKKLPWKGGTASWGKRIRHIDDMNEIPALLDMVNAKPDIKYVIIEDHTHIQNERLLSDKFQLAGQGQNKYARWESFGRDVFASIFGKAKTLRDDLFIIVIGHVNKDNDGTYSFKTFGKMVGNSVDPPSYARIVFHAIVRSDKKEPREKFAFLTNSDGIHEAKSPEGMFSTYIENDLYAAIKLIQEYDKVEVPVTNQQPS